ncbi:hypothetical protein KOR42_18130 [Thalassoglobus neptunius]|uniref:Uncharacterized protein n=1 Tax=Thalassoglobus neptunius TaxID=1938619 RepID=A0A5C5X711_9PLAN|nr:hypothetical protein KOR42_18130 [Thalassoglobus neptunius]
MQKLSLLLTNTYAVARNNALVAIETPNASRMPSEKL